MSYGKGVPRGLLFCFGHASLLRSIEKATPTKWKSLTCAIRRKIKKVKKRQVFEEKGVDKIKKKCYD
jgi:hypothetical protein